ncbi:MAG: hypothetical protein HKL82_08780 [Acidimicrobiaceae bacterium]|nr:hypothetical protein [Acidimicrobiaceae bacterium]
MRRHEYREVDRLRDKESCYTGTTTRSYLGKTAEAEDFKHDGLAIEAAVARGQAAGVALNAAAKIESLSTLLRDAELAFHQAIYEENQDLLLAVACSVRGHDLAERAPALPDGTDQEATTAGTHGSANAAAVASG